jgi:hypothetical protein
MRIDIESANIAGQTPAPERLASQPAVRSDTHRVVTVLWVKHWTEAYFSFAVTRPSSFRFRSGEFVMIGLAGVPGEDDGRPILRAYSTASPAWADELEFFSIKAPGGRLTSRLQLIQPGDNVLLAKKPTGTLVLNALKPGKRLFFLATGTGVSVAHDPDAYERYHTVVVAHCVREVKDLAYRCLFESTLLRKRAPARISGPEAIVGSGQWDRALMPSMARFWGWTGKTLFKMYILKAYTGNGHVWLGLGVRRRLRMHVRGRWVVTDGFQFKVSGPLSGSPLAVFLPHEPGGGGSLELKNHLPLIGRGMRQQDTEFPEDIAADDSKPPADDAERGRWRGSPTGAPGRLNNQRRDPCRARKRAAGPDEVLESSQCRIMRFRFSCRGWISHGSRPCTSYIRL